MPFWQRMRARLYGLQEEPVELRVPEAQPQTVERKWAAVPPEKLRLHLAALAIEEFERLHRAPARSSAAASSTAPTNS